MMGLLVTNLPRTIKSLKNNRCEQPCALSSIHCLDLSLFLARTDLVSLGLFLAKNTDNRGMYFELNGMRVECERFIFTTYYFLELNMTDNQNKIGNKLDFFKIIIHIQQISFLGKNKRM